MQCPKCNTENREGARFCRKCGAGLGLNCPQCGTELPLDALFCDACGAEVSLPPAKVGEEPGVPAPVLSPVEGLDKAIQRLVPREYAERLVASGGQMAGERRMVTILMSDVKGSSAMVRGMDPEEVMEVMDGAFEVLIEPIARYEGTVARLEGDAVLAFFGAPIAHEDDPERACRAGLEIVEGAQEYAARLEEERGISGFSVRVGIHTGLVVVGEVGTDLRMEYTAMGEAPNLTARLESAAEPGTVLISKEVHQFIAPLFETQALEPIQVKGWEQPVPVFRVLALEAAPGKPRGIAGLESPLVGREAECAVLQEAVERLQAGVGGIVTVVGEAGIGKSRLVAEVQTLAKVSEPSQGWPPVRWVEGRCLSYGTSIAYLLWLDALRSVLAMSVEDAPLAVHDALRQLVQDLCLERFDEVYPYLGRMMSLPLEPEYEAAMRDVEGEKLKAGTFQAVETLIQCAAGQRPLAVVCEDLHWADPTSLELLERLLALADQARLLIICIFRPEREHGSWRLREAAARDYRHRHTDLWLDPLSAAESETLVGNLLRVEDLPQGLKERILSRAEGNPFYVEEIIRSLIDDRTIVQDEATGRWETTRDVADIAIPDTLHGVLTARIDRLQEETKRVLQMAAVIGRIFLYRVLAAMAEKERELNEHLITLQREEMIRQRARLPELEYIFKHHLTQEAAYNGLLKRERRVFHRQVAEALERLFPDRVEEQVGLLAHHWERAGEADKATAYLSRAGDQARLAYAHQEAIDYYQRALALLKAEGDYERAARTLMKLGLTYHTAFRFGEARRAYEEGFALWQRAGETQEGVPPPPAPHALRVAWFGAPRELDPPMARDTASGSVVSQLFSGLAELSPELDVVPDVARTWEILEGGRKYVFHLRDDVRWSDGVPVTAGDFEYAWKRMLDPATESRNASALYDVKGARGFHQGDASDPDSVGVWALDEVTLVVELEEPTGYFPHLLTYNATYPVPRHAVQAHGEAWTEPGNIVTNGPFRLESWNRGESMVLVCNPEYHGPFGGNVERVELSLLAHPSARLELYEADGLDILRLWGLPPLEMDRARQRQAGEYVSVPWLFTFYVGFDVSRPPFSDPRVRRAFVLATDREALADVVMKGSAFPATGGLVPPGMPGHSAGIGLPYDPEQGQQILAEAGYPGGRGFPVVDAFTFLWQGIERIPQADWCENLGVEITWETMEAGMFWDRLDREPSHIFLSAWLADYPDPDSFLRASPVRRQSRWQNKTYDRLVEEARRVTDQGERMKLYRQADRILVEEAVVMPFIYERLNMLVKPWVRKYPTSALTGWFWKDVIIEAH